MRFLEGASGPMLKGEQKLSTRVVHVIIDVAKLVAWETLKKTF